MTRKRILSVLLAASFACGCALAQTTMATLQGTIVDPSDASVPGATVDLRNIATGAVRTTTSTSEGIFRFNSVPPALYDMAIKGGAGFKEYVSREIRLNANEIRDLGRLKLVVGAVTEEVQVTAAVTPVQTASSENASSIDFSQMERIKVRGRDLMSLLQTIPGANFGTTYLNQGGSGQSNYETVNPFALGALSLNGMSSAANFQVDGVTGMDSAGDSLTTFSPNVDSVAEIRVLATNYQAEYGRNLGGQIQVVTKSGSQEFHGSANVNKRHEMFNANSFFNNYNGLVKAKYRFFVTTYSIGGPIYIPGLFNTDKKRLFFFFSQEYMPQKSNPASGYANVPNPNHRKGDFSYYVNSQGNFIANSLRNPLTGADITPSANAGTTGAQDFSKYLSSFDAQSQKWGMAMLTFQPLPNLCNASAGTVDGTPWNGIASGVAGSNLISPTNCPSWITSQTTGLTTGNIDAQGGPGTTNNNTRNYYWIYDQGTINRRNDMARIDLNLTSKITAYVRYGNDYFLDRSNAAIPLKNVKTGKFEPTHTEHPNPGNGWAIGSTYAITPTMVNQLTLGYSWNDYAYYLNDEQLDRGNMLNPPSFINFDKDPNYNQPPQKRPLSPPGQRFFQRAFPAVSFGGGQMTESSDVQPFCNQVCPSFNFNPMYSVAESLSKTIGAHNFKIGGYWERVQKDELSGSNSAGSYSFSGGNVYNQQDTRTGFANAYLGNITSYSEGQKIIAYKVNKSLEFYLQDNWRVSRRLTLDLGVRFSHLPSMYDFGGNIVQFVPSTYNAAEVSRIFYPYCTVSTATAQCPNNTLTTKYQYSWDKAMNPSAAVGTGLGGPGNMYPNYLAPGTLVPAAFNGVSTGYAQTPNPYSGMQIATGSNPNLPIKDIYQVPRFAPAIRIGFAWDVFGNGRTAIRGGFGENLRREPNSAMSGVGGTPKTLGLNQYFGTVASIATNPLAGYTSENMPKPSQIIGLSVLGPTSVIGRHKYESTYNGSFQIQQDLGYSTVLQIGYVMVLRRHGSISTDQNLVTSIGTRKGSTVMYEQYQPAMLSPMTTYLDQYLPGNASGRTLSANYFRTQYPGLSGVTIRGFGANTNTHSLQASIRRNFTKRMSYSLSYTWLKTMSGTNRGGLFTDKYRDWGASYSPTPMYATITYVYELPGLAKRLNIPALAWVTDGWEVSGMTQFRTNRMTGYPGHSWSNTNSTNLVTPNVTGTAAEGARLIVLGSPYLIDHEVSFKGGPTTGASANIGVNGTPGNAIFNNASVMQPFPCSLTPNANNRIGVGQNIECFGNAGPGSLFTIPNTRTNNWDMTFTKRFPIKGEGRSLEFRGEMYNIFNHTQFTSASTGQSYDWNNWKTNGILVPTSGSTGRYNGAVAPRIMSFALRFTF